MRDDAKESQRNIVKFIGNFIDENGYSPSIREICKQTGINSTSTVFRHIQKLKETGVIVEGKIGTARSIRLNIKIQHHV